MKEYLTILAIFLLMDIIWLFATQSIFNSLIKDVQGTGMDVNWIPAVILYPLIVLALYILVSRRIQAVEIRQIIIEAAAYGGLFGAAAYGTYDLTNLATLSKWRWYVSVMDIAWGAIVSTTSTAIARIIFSSEARRYNKASL